MSPLLDNSRNIEKIRLPGTDLGQRRLEVRILLEIDLFSNNLTAALFKLLLEELGKAL